MIKKALKIIMILIMLMGITLSIYNYASSEKQTKGISNSKDTGSEKSKKSVDKEPGIENSKKPVEKESESENSKKTADKKSIYDSSFHGGPEEAGDLTGTMVILPDGSIGCQGAPLDC